MDNIQIQKIKDEQKELVENSTDLELLNLYNKQIGIPSGNWARMHFLSCIQSEFKKRNIDYSETGNNFNSILNDFTFNTDINKSIQDICEKWNKKFFSETKLIFGENENGKNFISLLLGKGLHLNSNSIINNKELNYPIGWAIRGIRTNGEKILYDINLNNLKLKFVIASPGIENIKIISDGLLKALNKFNNIGINEVSIVLFNFKGLDNYSEYFKIIINILEVFFIKDRNIKKVYLS